LTDWAGLAGILVAALGGAAIGVERQRSGHATGRHARLGGIRTFTLLGGVAGLAGRLSTLGLTSFAIVIVAGAVALVIASYVAVAASRHEVDGTTEAAALVVITAGLLAGLGWLALASGIVAVTTLLLVEKSRLHALVRRIDNEELRAATRFGVMAVVILPLLPVGPFGPMGGVRPRELWLLVLFFTGLSFAGYLARRAMGAAHGYPAAGLLAGVISSTSATLTFARLSRSDRPLSRPLAVGATGACTVLFPRVLIAAAVLDMGVARALWPYLLAPFLVGIGAVVVGLRANHPVPDATHEPPTNPLQIGPALQMAVSFQVVMFAVDAVRRFAGDVGLLVSGGLLGVADVDALTISMARSTSQGVAPTVAAEAIAIGIFVNSMLKMGMAVTLGSPQFRRAGGLALGAMALALAVAIGVLR